MTVSLDSLDDEAFRAMNDVDFPVERVLAGIDAAAAAGLPVKVNMVVKRGVNDDQVLEPGAPLPRHRPHRCASSSTWTSARRTAGGSTTSCRRRRSCATIDAEFPLEPVEPDYRGEVARRWRYRDGAGEIGVIASVTQPFCGDCTRARLSAEGRSTRACSRRAATTCARSSARGLGRGARRGGRPASGRVARDRYSEIRSERTATLPKVEMSYIGG